MNRVSLTLQIVCFVINLGVSIFWFSNSEYDHAGLRFIGLIMAIILLPLVAITWGRTK